MEIMKKCKNVQWFLKERSVELPLNKIKYTASDYNREPPRNQCGNLGVLTRETLHSNMK